MNETVTKEYIRRLRRSLGFTQDEFAELIGLKDRSEVSRLERGDRPLKAEQLLRLQILLGLQAKELLPKLWTKATNGVWEGIQVVRDVCTRGKGPGAREKCSFLKNAQQRVETLESQ